jgi:drug/metabolite transporter (DMT)-like permease
MTFILVAISLIAFAANSLLCRMALGNELIDPVSFTALRLLSGALVLVPISRFLAGAPDREQLKHSWKSGLALFGYASAFSLGYVSLSAGMGALILVGSVQVTMISSALLSGERLSSLRWTGSAISMGGLIYLVLPGISAPDPMGALLMFVSGTAWGIYSIRGRGATAPVSMTAANFRWAAPMALIASLIFRSSFQLEPTGILIAVCSGSITSALGYIIWYKALRHVTTARASIVQLLIPVMTAFGGVVFLSESISTRLLISSALILGGVAMGLMKRKINP